MYPVLLLNTLVNEVGVMLENQANLDLHVSCKMFTPVMHLIHQSSPKGGIPGKGRDFVKCPLESTNFPFMKES